MHRVKGDTHTHTHIYFRGLYTSYVFVHGNRTGCIQSVAKIFVHLARIYGYRFIRDGNYVFFLSLLIELRRDEIDDSLGVLIISFIFFFFLSIYQELIELNIFQKWGEKYLFFSGKVKV